MPTSPESARIAGKIAGYATQGPPILKNSILGSGDQVRLWLLTDIIAIPKAVPLANVFSIGDVLLAVGIGILCYRTVRRAPAAATTTRSSYEA